MTALTLILNRSIKLFLLSGFAVLFQGCVPPEAPPANTGNLSANYQPVVNANSPAANTATETTVSQGPVTLPLLDAMLADDAFVSEAKSTLQISDDQIQKLRDASRNAVLQLSEDGEDERSTRTSIKAAETQIREILGQEKTGRFISMVQKRWAGDDGGSVAKAAPSSVPTDTRIVVNAPAYRMDLFQDGKLVKTYKIGIGYPEFPLPTGLRKAGSIIFNPTWTPPDEPWVKGKLEPGKKIEAGSKLNPLGPIKIPIGLPSLIHGGKDPSRLGTFASHGCVGLTSPQIQDFAMQLSSLAGEPLTTGDIKNYEKQKTETKEVKLENAVPVELRYETIVVEDGKLKIFRDVYERGTNTEENLRRVLDTFGISLDTLNPAEREKILKGLEDMAIDAGGNAVDTDDGFNSDGSSRSANSNVNAKSNSGKVTRNIKGKKEVVFEIAALKGKGYPAPVGMKM